MISPEDFRRIQEVQLTIMDDIHRVCVERGYRYYLIGGSALGAVRHKGIIPWDVDIDIAMPRADYERFLLEGQHLLQPNHLIYHCGNDKQFGSVHAIVVLKDSQIAFRNERADNYRYGIFVDVLPLDQWPEDQRLKMQQQKKLKHIQHLRSLRFGIMYSSNSRLKRIVKFLGKIVLSSFVSKQKLNLKQQDIMKQFNTADEGEIWCSMVSHYSFDKTSFPKEIFGSPRLMAFSGRSFYVPEKVEEYLSQLFGNYWLLPSEDSRNSQMNSVVFASWTESDSRITIINK